MSWRLREITETDLAAILEVRLSTIENAITLEEMDNEYGVTPESIARDMRAGAVRGWLAEADGRMVGFAMGDGQSGEVGVVAVLPSHEGRGIGKAVLDAVVDWLLACGHAELWLKTTPDPALRASGFYRHLGWRASGRMVGSDEILTYRRGGD